MCRRHCRAPRSPSPSITRTLPAAARRSSSTGSPPLTPPTGWAASIFDPGGPGGSGTRLIALEALGNPPAFTSGVRDDYDLIGFDPRGVGLSDPIRCSAALFNQPIDYFPQTGSAFRRLVAHNRALGRSCERNSGPLAADDDTISVARDLDAVRAALGEPTLNFLGLSYGTEIGALYARGSRTGWVEWCSTATSSTRWTSARWSSMRATRTRSS